MQKLFYKMYLVNIKNWIFSIKKDEKYKIINFLGFKIKFKRNTRKKEQIILLDYNNSIVCNICGNNSYFYQSGKILNKYNINYYYCPFCEHLQTEETYWLDKAYDNAINDLDIGLLYRNEIIYKIVSNIIFNFFNINGKFLDYASGYGVLVRKMRDVGFDFYWEDKYCQNIFAKFFEYKNCDDKIELITAIEFFEHSVNPIKDFEYLFSISNNILFTQEILPEPVPNIKDWWYFSLETGQHISFYTNKTLDYIAKKYNKQHIYYKNIHLFTNNKISCKDFKNSCINAEKNINYIKNKLTSKLLYEDIQICKKNIIDKKDKND